MRKNLAVGILRETKQNETRAPLTPSDVEWLIKRGINVEVESSTDRVFDDDEYKKAGAKVVNKFRKASLLVGVKGPLVENLYRGKIYMVFSHTMKGQPRNMPLLKSCMKKGITLIDYEKIVDTNGQRLVYFGRFAGICGMVDSLCYLGKKLLSRRIQNPFASLQQVFNYKSLNDLNRAMAEVKREIFLHGFKRGVNPFIIGITGSGNVSKGAQEILDILEPVEIQPKNLPGFFRTKKGKYNKVFKVVFRREEKVRAKDKKPFYYEEYLKNPEKFESNMDKYLPFLNLLVHSSYWDKRYPRLVTKKMINNLHKKKPSRLQFVGDISCDVEGAMELTHKTTSFGDPTFTYNPENRKFVDGYESPGITILAIDNLPSELPKDSSAQFGSLIREYVYQIAAHGAKDVANHVALPQELRKAVIAQQGRLTRSSSYLQTHILDE
jgi:alpha-aminoadipic semialdehyde synthase